MGLVCLGVILIALGSFLTGVLLADYWKWLLTLGGTFVASLSSLRINEIYGAKAKIGALVQLRNDFERASMPVALTPRASARRAVWLTVVPLLLGVAITVYSAIQARTAREQTSIAMRERLVAQAQKLVADTLYRSLTAAQDSLTRMRESLEAARSGINLYHAGRYSEAVAAYDNALKNDPSNSYVLNLKGYALFKAGRLSDAVDELRRAVAANPAYGYGYLDLARVYCAQNKLSDALDAVRNALKTRPDLKIAMLTNDSEFVRLCKPILSSIRAL